MNGLIGKENGNRTLPLTIVLWYIQFNDSSEQESVVEADKWNFSWIMYQLHKDPKSCSLYSAVKTSESTWVDHNEECKEDIIIFVCEFHNDTVSTSMYN